MLCKCNLTSGPSYQQRKQPPVKTNRNFSVIYDKNYVGIRHLNKSKSSINVNWCKFTIKLSCGIGLSFTKPLDFFEIFAGSSYLDNDRFRLMLFYTIIFFITNDDMVFKMSISLRLRCMFETLIHYGKIIHFNLYGAQNMIVIINKKCFKTL